MDDPRSLRGINWLFNGRVLKHYSRRWLAVLVADALGQAAKKLAKFYAPNVNRLDLE